jgi:alkylation response protein AidB-like acyl-CoA dehydrogenase
MQFDFTPEQQELVALARRIGREQVAPRAAAVDEAGQYPEEIFRAFRDAGLLGVGLPEQYGGAGMGSLGLCLAVEQVAQYCCASGLMLLLTKLPLMPIMLGGTGEREPVADVSVHTAPQKISNDRHVDFVAPRSTCK